MNLAASPLLAPHVIRSVTDEKCHLAKDKKFPLARIERERVGWTVVAQDFACSPSSVFGFGYACSSGKIDYKTCLTSTSMAKHLVWSCLRSLFQKFLRMAFCFQ